MSAGPSRQELPGARVVDGFECWESNSGPLEEQYKFFIADHLPPAPQFLFLTMCLWFNSLLWDTQPGKPQPSTHGTHIHVHSKRPVVTKERTSSKHHRPGRILAFPFDVLKWQQVF